MLSLILILVAASSQGSPYSGIIDGGVVAFDDKDVINISQANLAIQDSNSSYPLGCIAVYRENQTISGTFQGPRKLAGTMIRISLARFRPSELLIALNGSPRMGGKGSLIQLNDTGLAQFSLPGVASGAYLISMIDARNLTMLCVSPILVAKGELSVLSPPELKAEGLVRIRVRMSEGNESKIVGAIMMPKKEYDTARLDISTNGTAKGLLTTISLGNRSQQIQGLPINSSQLIMSMLAILPADSALAYQESKGPEVELIFLTDKPFEKGEYVLTCAAYSAGKGLLGLKQTAIKVT